MGEVIAFCVLAVILVGASLGAVLTKDLFRSALLLTLALATTAGFYLILQAEALAMIQILLYTGGIITLLVFAIMLTGKLAGARISHVSHHLGRSAVISGLFFLLTLIAVWRSEIFAPRAGFDGKDVTLALSQEIFGPLVLPFEILSVLLLAAIIGALVIARKEE